MAKTRTVRPGFGRKDTLGAPTRTAFPRFDRAVQERPDAGGRRDDFLVSTAPCFADVSSCRS
jgi:hypothetical protein